MRLEQYEKNIFAFGSTKSIVFHFDSFGTFFYLLFNTLKKKRSMVWTFNRFDCVDFLFSALVHSNLDYALDLGTFWFLLILKQFQWKNHQIMIIWNIIGFVGHPFSHHFPNYRSVWSNGFWANHFEIITIQAKALSYSKRMHEQNKLINAAKPEKEVIFSLRRKFSQSFRETH